ncbi:hypothetical protein QQ045_022135 [Rhodiola kirilowii]
MDSELDSLDDFLAAPADEGAARKFKPKPKGRPKPRTKAAPSTAPNTLKEKHDNSTPTLLDTTQENVTEVTNLSPPNGSTYTGDSVALNNSDEPHLRASMHQGDSVSTEPLNITQEAVTFGDGGSEDVFCGELPVSGEDSCQNNAVEQCPSGAESASLRWDPFDDIDLEQSINIAIGGGKFRSKLKPCPAKQTLTSAESGLFGAVKEDHVEIFSDGSDSKRQGNLRGTDVSGNNDMAEGNIQDGVPFGDDSSINVGLDDVQFDFATDEGKSPNTNEEVFLGDMTVESYQCDAGEVPSSNIMVEHENLHLTFVDQELNTCDSSHDQAMLGVTGNQHGMINRDSTTSKPSNIDSGTMEPESCGVFDSELPDGRILFPSAGDYFSINEPSMYGSEIGQSGTSLPDDDMHVETAHEIPAERVDDSAPAEGTGTRQSSRVSRKRKARSTQPSEAVEDDGLHGELCTDSSMSQDVSKDNNEGDTTLKKKGGKRSTKSATGNGQQTTRRKKVNDTSNEQNEKPKKKFSHSTRGRRKHVDPIFLATPDDEIDPSSVILKDLILRAEILERDSKKVPTPASTPAVNQRTKSPSPSPWDEPYFDERNDYDSYQNGDYDSYQNEDYDDENVAVQESSSYFNYHSFMTKTPRVTWSKVDTELFYQGIRQFGTDFTLIQQLFPGRTRNQIKLKYKKEERQHPQRITEAIENKASGITYFQQVIRQLKADNAQEDQELSDDLNGAEANEDIVQEASAELNDNASTRTEQNDGVVKDDADAVHTTTEDQQELEKTEDEYDYFELDYAGL